MVNCKHLPFCRPYVSRARYTEKKCYNEYEFKLGVPILSKFILPPLNIYLHILKVILVSGIVEMKDCVHLNLCIRQARGTRCTFTSHLYRASSLLSNIKISILSKHFTTMNCLSAKPFSNYEIHLEESMVHRKINILLLPLQCLVQHLFHFNAR